MTENTSSYAGAVANKTKQANNGNKAKHQIPKSGNYPTGHPNNGGQKIKPPPKKKTIMAMNQDKSNVEEIKNKGGHRNQRWKNIPEPVKQNWIEKNERETKREIIFLGVPSPKTYEDGTALAEAKHVFGILDELRTTYLGNTYGVNVKSTDFAFAARQLGRNNKDFLPITGQFRNEEIVKKILQAAKWAKILNRRKKSHYGRHKIPSPTEGEDGEKIEPSAEAIKMDQERPKIYIRASRTYAEQEADREKWNHRNSKSYIQRQEMNSENNNELVKNISTNLYWMKSMNMI